MPLPELDHYEMSLRQNADPSLGKDMRAGKEADRVFVEAIVKMQHSLQPGQALVLCVALAEKDEDYGEIEGYAGLVHDAPMDLLATLEPIIDRGQINIEGLEDRKLLSQLEIIVPPNIIPEGDGVANTSASRAAVSGGDVKRFLGMSSVRTTYLDVFPTGVSLESRFSLHSSVIKDIRIDEVGQDDKNISQIKFKIIN